MTKFVLSFLTVTLSLGLFAQNSQQSGDSTRSSWSVAAGASLPLGSFKSAPINGTTKTGAALSAEFTVGGSTAWISSILASYNPTEPNTVLFPQGSTHTYNPWWTIWPMTGIVWRTEASPSISLELDGQVGLFLGISPAISVHVPGVGDASVSSDRALAVSAGVGAGATLSDHYTLKVRYLYAKPGYDLTVVDLGVTSTERHQQTTSLLALTLGWTW